MANTYVTETVSGATFDDACTGAGPASRSWSPNDDATDFLLAAGDKTGDTIISTVNGAAGDIAGALVGTLIDTPFGASAIETLRAGDLVTVVEGSRRSSRPVRRVARMRIGTARTADPAAALLVRIRRDAFADNVPARDLLLTAGQCVHVAGRLIPARLLVNGASIIFDTAIVDTVFIHLELDRHAVLLVEGLETESASYRSTHASGAPVSTTAEHAKWVSTAAMPPCLDRAAVEPIRARLAERAERLGLRTREWASLPAELALHLRIADGAIIAPVLRDGAIYAFVVPEGATGLRLVGPRFGAGTPVAPFPDNRRARGIGMGIGDLGMSDIDGSTSSVLHLINSALPGWHALEQDETDCWIDGDAGLPIETTTGPMVLVVEVPVAGPFHACGNA